MNAPRVPVAASSLTLVLLVAIAHAQSTPAPSPEPKTPEAAESPQGDAKAPVRALEKVDVTASPLEDVRRESTTTRIVVTHDEIVRYGDTEVADVLARLPGISVDTLQGRTVIRMRGLGEGYTQILLDGEPAPPGFSLESLSPEMIERIEILRVPTADVSTQAIAGSINIILRKAAKGAHRSVKLRASDDDGEPGYGADFDVSDHANNASYVVAGSMSRASYDRSSRSEQHGVAPDGTTNLLWQIQRHGKQRVDGASLAPRITWNPTERDTLTSESLIRYWTAGTDDAESTETLEGAPPTFSSDQTHYRYEATAAWTSVGWVHRAGDGSTLDVKLAARYSHRAGDSHFHGFDEDGTSALERTIESSTIECGATSSGKYLTPIVEGHALGFGWDGEYTHRDERRFELDLSPQTATTSTSDEIFHARLSRLGFYGQDEWDITPRWSAYLGVRWEDLDTRTNGNTTPDVGNDSSILSPILQTLWKAPGKADQVRFGLSRTYKAPRLSELTPRLYLANNNTPTTPDERGNPDLRPERAWGLDAAYEHYFGESGLASISAYARRIDDVIVYRVANVDGTWIDSPVNGGRASVHGIEAEAKFALRDVWDRAPDVRVHAHLARNWSRVEGVPGPDNRLERQTPVTGGAGLDYALAHPQVTLGVNFTFAGGGPVRISANESEDLPAKRVLDFYALWQADARTKLRLSLANVLRPDRVGADRYFDDNGGLTLTATRPTHTIVRIAVELTL